MAHGTAGAMAGGTTGEVADAGTPGTAVNAHYLDRVVAVAEHAGVEASEDIVSGNGLKLVAKGTRLDGRLRERLLAHKLSQPLESSVRVVEGVTVREIEETAQALLATHPLLAALCDGRPGRDVHAALRALHTRPPVESLLSVYARQSLARRDHAVGVAVVAAALHAGTPGGRVAALPTLILAGLLHDVGELYLDPALLSPGRRLAAGELRQIAAHPAIAGTVLRAMPGAGPAVADTVLGHHERLDGFGYPQGLRGERLGELAQVLAVAEMLMGVLEGDDRTPAHASVAVKVVPGEFDRRLVDRVVAAASACGAAGDARALDAATLSRTVLALGESLRAFEAVEARAAPAVAAGSAGLHELAAHVEARCLRIRQGFSSTGLDTHAASALGRVLGEMSAREHREVAAVLDELHWRLRELGREARRRAERLAPGECDMVVSALDAALAAARAATTRHGAGTASAAGAPLAD